MNIFKLKLSNNETKRLISEKTLEEVKEDITKNKWIALTGNRYSEEDIDVQTCNIVYVIEDIQYKEILNKLRKKKTERIELIKEITKYEFNRKMKWWFKINTLFINYNKNSEQPLHIFDEEFLNKILKKCKQYKCKLK